MKVSKLLLPFAFLNLGLLSISCDAKPKTEKEKISYAIGQQIGESIKAQSIDVDVDMLARSIKDVMGGKTSQLTRDEMRQTMMNAQKGAEEKQKADGEKNKKTGDEFLAKNKTAEGVKTNPSGLQYKVIKEGTGKIPAETDTVKVHYKGTLIDGKEFDSSYSRGEPAEFPVNKVIPGWTEALKTMKVGEKRQLFIPSELAYGPVPRPGIPANSVLLFDVELIDITKAGGPALPPPPPGGPKGKPAAPAPKPKK